MVLSILPRFFALNILAGLVNGRTENHERGHGDHKESSCERHAMLDSRIA